jgi:LPS-assembly protein
MNQANKGKAKYFSCVVCTAMILLLSISNISIGFNNINFHKSLTADTLPAPTLNTLAQRNIVSQQRKLDTLPVTKTDSTSKITTDTFNFKLAKGALEAPVEYHADDSMVLNAPAQTIILYGKKSTIDFDQNNLEAPQIEYDQKTNLVRAFLTKDSNGRVVSYPKFVQGDMSTQSDTILFNMKTQKGITKGTYTQQGEMYVYGETIKKVDNDVFYALRGRFTTCNLDTPHFAFVSSKIKFITNKMAFTGPVHPEFEGVPVPVILPFGIYPLSQGRHSGFIAPQFASNDQQGLALENMGYYKVLSDNWDVQVRGTLYSYGGWMANVSPNYYKRYRYRGAFNYSMQRFKTNFKGDPDYISNRTMNVQWNHSSDSKARPGVSFRASVNAGSSKYNEQVPNSPNRNFSNQLQSTIAYSKTWKDKPFNLSLNATHNQNTLQRLINVSLPDLTFSVNTLYPFRRKEPIGDYKWYENLGIALNTVARNQTSFYDTAQNIGRQMIDRLQWGASHSVPISLSLPPLGPLQIAPSVSYQENWHQIKRVIEWNDITKKQDTTDRKGFYRSFDMSFGVGASTRVFGMFTFRKGKVTAIRHEIRPNISVSYKPDINGRFYNEVIVDTSGRKARYSNYENNLYPTFGFGKFGGLSFGLDNNLSMKVRNKKDTSAGGLKKVSILDGFGITGNYNFLRDSLKLGLMNVYARSNLFEKVSITGTATFDPYEVDSLGQSINTLVWKRKPISLGNLLNASVSMQTSFRGGDKTKPAQNNNLNNSLNRQTTDINGFPLDEYQQELAYINNNPGDFVDFSIPWSINLSYSLSFNRIFSRAEQNFNTDINQSISGNADLNLTPKWKVGLTSSYNISTKELGQLSMFLSREMHCWQMSINIAPVGRFKYFNISISPKSSLLRDLKINRTRSFVDL